MTGFGKGESSDGARSYSVQLKSVNNRFLELGLKLPSDFWAYEAEARALLQSGVSRGKVDMHWKESALAVEAPKAQVDADQARAWKQALQGLAQELGLPMELRLETLTRLPGVLGSEAATAEGDAEAAERWKGMRGALAQAVAALQASREGEGAALGVELKALLADGEARVAAIEAGSAALQAGFAERTRKRMAQILETVGPDDPRVIAEAALLADKADIREELVRYRAHSAEFRRLLEAAEPVGKKLDFLCQELLREVNTMGSKSPEASLTQAVVGLKSVVERVKEQVQNIE
ncbi:MAG TPA: YicC/YloC family endoribonuclease [bacterium]|nr:YicC/YloC family endoribonuclease [bacterium]